MTKETLWVECIGASVEVAHFVNQTRSEHSPDGHPKSLIKLSEWRRKHAKRNNALGACKMGVSLSRRNEAGAVPVECAMMIE